MKQPANNRIVFKDHSDDFLPAKMIHPVNLPDPHCIAIHAAIAEVLHKSGAGKFFDELLDKFKDDEGNVPPVGSWPELENLHVERLLFKSVSEMFQSIGVL